MADNYCLSKNKNIGDCFISPTTYLIKIVLFLSLLYIVIPADITKTCHLCEEGNCINDTCVCLPGWRGKYCNECHGRISLHGTEGVIHDGSSNYSKDHTCSWLLDTGQIGLRITFHVNYLETECNWDHLYVHNGDSAFDPLVAAYSGGSIAGRSRSNLKFKLTGQYAFIHFYSDAAFTLSGFNVSYVADNCSMECSDNGVCNEGRCECMPGWSGTNCDVDGSSCPNNCSGHGRCDDLNGSCICSKGFRGPDCFTEEKYMLLEKMPSAPASMSGRASIAFAKDTSDGLWITGGYRMGINSIENNLLRYDTDSKLWTKPTEENLGPWPRYGHTSVFYKESLYLYGGIKQTEVMGDLWKYSIDTQRWTRLTSGPRTLSGHTAEVVGTRMLIFFGYSSRYAYSNKVLEYDFDKQDWQVVKTRGSVVIGSHGHSSVYDTLRDKIYIYGGYKSAGQSKYNLTGILYEFQPSNNMWTILHSSGKGQYLHSAAMINGLMLVFGGNTNNDSGQSRHTECYTSDFLVYDRDCNRWHTQNIYPKSHSYDLDRFGQRMVSVQNDVYMFGGFHAWSKTELWKMTSGLCSAFSNETSCSQSFPGIKCLWSSVRGCQPDLDHGICKDSIDKNFNCSGMNRCVGCLETNGCQWCGDACFSVKATGMKNCSVKSSSCKSSAESDCSIYRTCRSCREEAGCDWANRMCQVIDSKQNKTLQEGGGGCKERECSDMDSCSDCTKAKCMWCSNLKQCILTNAYVAFYFYGQCMEWTTQESVCKASECSLIKSCGECTAHPRCGWCDDNSGTGTGFCHAGGMTGPVVINGTPAVTDQSICPSTWAFTECPACQCNGHATCMNGTGACETCAHHTSGPHCEFCEDGYFGQARNGGNCSACNCNDRADSCNPSTGDCYCKIRGVAGKSCNTCDDDYKFLKHGGGTCFYHLITDFSYTFNLSKREDANYTQINFMNTPTSGDRDVDFTLNCTSAAVINITYTSKSHPIEKEFVTNRVCDYFRTKFEHKNHAFGGKENTTFFVYVYDFKTPFMLQISFSQFPKIDLVHFFVTFFSCFLSLLLIAALVWKVKHKYDSYRRRRQLIVEMQQMASRPFSTIFVEIDHKLSAATTDKKDHFDSVLRRRKKAGSKPSEVAIEPLADSKAAILTLIIQLPTGGNDHTPPGQSGLAMGSALVSMGSHRKQSLDHAKGDKPKNRKHLSNINSDNCA